VELKRLRRAGLADLTLRTHRYPVLSVLFAQKGERTPRDMLERLDFNARLFREAVGRLPSDELRRAVSILFHAGTTGTPPSLDDRRKAADRAYTGKAFARDPDTIQRYLERDLIDPLLIEAIRGLRVQPPNPDTAVLAVTHGETKLPDASNRYGFVAPPRIAAASEHEIVDLRSVRDGEDMLRRELVKAIAAYAVGGAVANGTVENTTLPGSDAVEEWREAAEEYGYDYLSKPRRELISDLNEDIAIVRRILDGLSNPVEYQGLSSVAGRLYALTAMACTDVGYSREARHMWRLARHAADYSGESAVQVWVRGHESTLGIYEGRPLSIVLDLAERGLAAGGDSASAGRAELLGGKAEALALQGRKAEAVATLHEMERVFEALPDNVTSQYDSIAGWPEYRLRHAQSFVYTSVGLTKEALQAQDRAFTLYPGTRTISRSQIGLHRAECLIKDGHLADGARHATNALQSVPMERRKRLVLRVAAKVWDSIPDSERKRPESLELRAAIKTADYDRPSAGAR
jgi:hypothetical protein